MCRLDTVPGFDIRLDLEHTAGFDKSRISIAFDAYPGHIFFRHRIDPDVIDIKVHREFFRSSGEPLAFNVARSHDLGAQNNF